MRISKLRQTACEREFLLLGYPLCLSPEEATLVHLLKKKRTRGIVSLPNTSANALAVRVYSINQKALRISGRKLIVFSDGAYRLNPYL